MFQELVCSRDRGYCPTVSFVSFLRQFRKILSSVSQTIVGKRAIARIGRCVAGQMLCVGRLSRRRDLCRRGTDGGLFCQSIA